MEKSNKEILDFFGLKVGDKVKVKGYNNPFVILEESGILCAEEIREDYPFSSTWEIIDFIYMLYRNNYGTITPKKKLGDMKCGEMSCSECPFISFDCSEWRLNSTNVVKSIPKATLYEVLEGFMTIYNFEKIREELDEEVEECEK